MCHLYMPHQSMMYNKYQTSQYDWGGHIGRARLQLFQSRATQDKGYIAWANHTNLYD